MKKALLAIIAALVVAGGLIGYNIAIKDEAPQPATTSQTPHTDHAATEPISYQGEEGKNALELLKKSYKVETKSYEALGELVTSINGETADSKHFWAFYVNGQPAQVGASSYITKASEKIEWKLEEIK